MPAYLGTQRVTPRLGALAVQGYLGDTPTTGGGVAAPLVLSTTNRFRTPISTASTGSSRYRTFRYYLGTAPYDDWGFIAGFASHYSKNDGSYPTEAAAPTTFDVLGWSIGYGATNDPAAATWVRGTIEGADSAELDPAINDVGVVTDELIAEGGAIPAGQHRWLVVACDFRAASAVFPRAAQMAPNLTIEGAAANSVSPQTAQLTNGAAMSTGASGNGGAYAPSFLTSKGAAASGNKAYVTLGDSIGEGQDELLQGYDEGTYGFLARGLNDAADRRFAIHMCVPGSYPRAIVDNGRAAIAKKLDLLALLPGSSPVTDIISEHGLNSAYGDPNGWSTLETFVQGMKDYVAVLEAEWPGKPVHQTTITQNIASTSDGYRTLAGQAPATGFGVGGHIQLFNQKLRDDLIDGTFASYIDVAWALTDPSDRTKFLVNNDISTTLASDYVSGTSITVTDATGINPGDAIVIDPTGVGSAPRTRVAASKSGNVLTLNTSFGIAVSAGAAIVGSYIDDTVHPTKAGHVLAAQDAVIPWKAAN